MPKITKTTVIQLVVACFIVGFLMSYWQVTPKDVVVTAAHWAEDVFDLGVNTIGTIGSYVVLGAVIVIPVWLAYYSLSSARDLDDKEK